MRRALLSAAAVSVLASSSALAADLGVPVAPVVKEPLPVASYDWTGAYFGGHIGGGRQSTTFSDPSSFGIIEFGFPMTGLSSGAPDQKVGGSSFLGGLQAGWNYQIGRLVLGTEYDISWIRLNGTSSAPFPTGNVASGNIETFSSNTKWTATSTTRLGVARNNWLFYGKIGAAWTNANYSLTHNGFCSAVCAGAPYNWAFLSTVSDTRLGWTVGTGMEWAFARNWTFKVEYDYMDFGSKPENFPGTLSAPAFPPPLPVNIATNVHQQVLEVKVGLNWKADPGFLFW
jgi:outer membrane immunogenic protein